MWSFLAKMWEWLLEFAGCRWVKSVTKIITPKTTLLLRWVWQIAVVAQNMAVYLQSLTGKSVQPLFTLKVKAVPYVLKLTCFH